jgi:hypothetical protein
MLFLHVVCIYVFYVLSRSLIINSDFVVRVLNMIFYFILAISRRYKWVNMLLEPL